MDGVRSAKWVMQVKEKMDWIAFKEIIFFQQVGDVFALMHPQLMCVTVSFELDSNELGDWSHVFDAKMLMDLLLDPG